VLGLLNGSPRSSIASISVIDAVLQLLLVTNGRTLLKTTSRAEGLRQPLQIGNLHSFAWSAIRFIPWPIPRE
jgi:hypothetical protein